MDETPNDLENYLKFHTVVRWVKPRIRYFTRFVAILAFSLVATRSLLTLFAKELPEVVSHFLGLSFQEAVVIAMFMLLLERVVVVQQLLESHLQQSREVISYKSRVEAFTELCHIVRERANLVTKVDLLQFSGSTSVAFLLVVASECPNATIRLLLFDPAKADQFDDPSFHRDRIAHTMTVVKTIKEDRPNLKIDVWYYDSEPAISAAVIDNWAVSVGWYRVYPNSASPTGRSLRSHADAGLTLLDSEAEPVRTMVERQVNALIHDRTSITDSVVASHQHLPPDSLVIGSSRPTA